MRFLRENRLPLVVALGALLVVGGGVTALRAQGTANAGWFAYAPGSGQVFSPGSVVVSSTAIWGAAAAAAGLLLLVGTFAYVVGLRRGQRDSGSETPRGGQSPTDGST